MGWVADRNNRPVPTRGTPHTERKLQVVLATRAFTLMPICACEPSGKLTATKQFALSQARRVPLRWPVLYLSILIVAQESGSTGCRQSFIPPLHEYRGFPERILHDSTFVLSYGICVFIWHKGEDHAKQPTKATKPTTWATAYTVSAIPATDVSTSTEHHRHAAEAATLIPDTGVVLLLHRLVVRYHLGARGASAYLYHHSCAHRIADAQCLAHGADALSEVSRVATTAMMC